MPDRALRPLLGRRWRDTGVLMAAATPADAEHLGPWPDPANAPNLHSRTRQTGPWGGVLVASRAVRSGEVRMSLFRQLRETLGKSLFSLTRAKPQPKYSVTRRTLAGFMPPSLAPGSDVPSGRGIREMPATPRPLPESSFGLSHLNTLMLNRSTVRG